jgi:hypothetical protein
MGKPKKKHIQQSKITTNAYSDYPKFCFKYLMNEPKADPKSKPGFYAEFVGRLKKLSSLGWDGIDHADKHGLGYEKMSIKKIKTKNLPMITPDMDYLTVFRATGDNRAFLGIRQNDVFHVILIEENFGDVYDHR